jgi:signal peptidase I
MFRPRYLKQAKLLLRHSQKYLRYKSDVMEASVRDEIDAGMRRLQGALRQRDRKQIESRAEELDRKLHQLAPVTVESHWRENCEVILVAIVVAVGIRSYFLQPFKIPTGSMQPTLNGIIGHPGTEPAPNILRQAAEFVLLGRNYINVVAKEDDEIQRVQQKKFLFFFTFSRIIGRQQDYVVYASPEILRQYFNVYGRSEDGRPGRLVRRDEVIARGAIDTGDQVFVDKFTYNFVKPHRGDVFVFRTNNIPGIREEPETGAPFYIKRLAGLPGDTLRIDPPLLYINGKLAEGYGFHRVMSAQPPYRGYSEGPLNAPQLERQLEQIRADKEAAIRTGAFERVPQLQADEEKEKGRLEFAKGKLPLPEHRFFALGDNSYNSYDSRWWGPVPEENLVGRGLLVYWPFIPHWGLIR